MDVDTDVVIVGAGPVGLALATLLGRAGRDVRVLERRTALTPLDESRAITWMPEGLLFADELGIADELRASASIRTRHEFRRHPQGRPILTMRMDQLDHRHPYTLNLPQHITESLLEREALATARVQIERGFAVVDADQADHRVEATVAHSDGRRSIIRAKMGIAADGAQSTRSGVAKLLGIGSEYTSYHARTVVADVDLETEPADGSISWVALDPRRPTGAFRFGERRWRVIYRVNANEDADRAVHRDLVAEIVRRVWPGARVARTLWVSSFRLGQGQARTYASGLWFLAGDAAHAMGPSAGAGMMVGFLGARELGRSLGSGGSLAEVAARYERRQRATSRSVQASNKLIFRNIALGSPALGALRNTALAMIGRSARLAGSFTAREALVSLASHP